MDDLISRKTAIDQTMGKLDYTDLVFDTATESEIVYMLRCLPSVPAVPLDKLCEWLGEQGMLAPCFFADNACDDCKMGKYWERKKSECWKKCLTKWMEGLDAAD